MLPLQVPVVSGVSVYSCKEEKLSAPVSSPCSSQLCPHRCDDGAHGGLHPTHRHKCVINVSYGGEGDSTKKRQSGSHTGSKTKM